MKAVGAYEAKTHLPQLLERVRQGERITITKHGAPIAILSPVSSPTKEEIEATISRLNEFGREHKLGSLNLQEMIAAGRRF